MNKKIAVYANGWNHEILSRFITGMKNAPGSEKMDLFIFTSYATTGNKKDEILGEERIYALPDMRDFDGVVILSNTLHSQETAKKLGEQALACHVPAISVGMKIDGISYIEIDNKTGMHQLVNHLIEDHNVKRIAYIGGTIDHPDSIERLNITKEVLEAHGYSMEEDDIHHANWGYSIILGVVQQIIADSKGLPDAIVCANDFTALAAIAELKLHNINVPEDVIVTGFDSIDDTKTFYPSITSVENDYASIGLQCSEYFLSSEGMDSTHPVEMTSTSKMVPCESCCKHTEPIYEKIRRDFCSENYAVTLRNDVINRKKNQLEYDIISSSDINSLKMVLYNHYKYSHLIEGENFHILFNPLFLQNTMDDFHKICSDSMSEKFDILLTMQDGNVLLNYNDISVSRHDLIPGYEHSKGAHVYHLVGLNWDQCFIGYVVFVDNSWLLEENAISLYINGIRQALQRLRINMRLDILNQNLYALYNKDAMTGLYNRFGYESLAVPLFEQQKMDHQPVMVCFLDINRMKYINDVYGHLQGDLAIATVANAIKSHERKNWIGIRYGGDEFLIIASCSSEEEADLITHSILNKVKEITDAQKFSYNLDVSCGYVLTDPKSPTTLQEYIKQADDMMYEIKRKLHEREKQNG